MVHVTRQGHNPPPPNIDTSPYHMTPESVQAMIDQALLRNSTNRDVSQSSHEDNPRHVQTTRPYQDLRSRGLCNDLGSTQEEDDVGCRLGLYPLKLKFPDKAGRNVQKGGFKRFFGGKNRGVRHCVLPLCHIRGCVFLLRFVKKVHCVLVLRFGAAFWVCVLLIEDSFAF
nr:hypothetical protein [Tanacetum cinerariifolium]GFB05062.1 hypothetical protein [Tanacetum cinerariifolium]